MVRRFFVGSALIAIAGCGGAVAAPAPAPVPATIPVVQQATSRNCAVTDSTALVLDTINIVVVPPPASRPGDVVQSEGDRFAFRQMYQTLTRLDCEGNVLPGLASTWKREESGSGWTFELAPGATFADGSPVDAQAIVTSWQQQLAGPSAWPGLTAVQATSARSVQLQFDVPDADAPRRLSDQRYAVLGPPMGNGLRAESGPYSLSIGQPGRDGAPPAILLKSREARAPGPVLRLAVLPAGTDPRDAIDRGISELGVSRADVLMTRDPDLLSYAARHAEYRSVALPWDLTYVLVAQAPPNSPFPSSPFAPPSARAALARDAVRSDARAAEPPFWWERDSSCVSAATHADNPQRVLGYRAGDPLAKGLAERIVALASLSERPEWIPGALAGDARAQLRVAPIAADSLDAAVGAGRVIAAIVAYPRERPAGCAFGPRRGANLIENPLVDSRAHVIVRRGVSFTIDGDGGIRFAPERRP